MDSLQPMAVAGTYDYRLVALSVVLAVGASYAALDLAGRVTVAQGRARRFWLTGGAIAMGSGIWAMHYIGMLAFSMPMPVLYDLPTVGLSLLAAIGASAVALFLVSRPSMGGRQEAIGSLAMGSGIAAMHYIGMAAMRMPARIRYNPATVSLSIVLAVVISLVALILAFQARNEKGASLRKVVSALVMGSAIPLMHYTGMAAATFIPTSLKPDLSHAIEVSRLGVTVISMTSLLVLVMVMVTAFMDRLLAAQKAILEVSRENASHFRTMAETIPQIIWTTPPDGNTDYVNQRWHDYTGLDWEQSLDLRWGTALHPEDLPSCQKLWTRSVESGETFEMEYRLRRAVDKTYRWHLARAVPIRDSQGSIVKWFGTATDIDDQKHSQQNLEEQVRERTAEVVAGNARLKQEMQEREDAQHKLNEQNATMLEELSRRSARSVVLAKMGKLLQSSDTVKEAIPIVLGFAPKIFPGFRGSLLLFNASRSALEVAGVWSECEMPEGSSFEANCCWALRTGQRHLVQAGDRTALCTHVVATNCYLCVPIMTQGAAVGILHLQSMTGTRDLLESEILLASSFAEQVGLSISNLRLQEALRQQSIKDTLTGLYNRRHLEESMEREIRRAARADQPMGVIMFDLDHFKTFNDTFGHDAGDAVLRELGVFLSRNVRAEDVPCRFGGEEFLLILPGSNLEGTRTRAERLRSQIKELNVVYQGKSLGIITISSGVAAFPSHGLLVRELIAAADGALYQAKRGGRDQVIVAPLPTDIEQAAATVTAGR